MVTKTKAAQKKGKVKVGRLEVNKETVKDLTNSEEKKVKGGIFPDLNKRLLVYRNARRRSFMSELHMKRESRQEAEENPTRSVAPSRLSLRLRIKDWTRTLADLI
jgi:hypothetical protein